MGKCLADFAYHIDISWIFFAISGFIAIAVTLITVGWQAVKAAVLHPVKSLRSE